MLEELLIYLNNFFVRAEDIKVATYSIDSGKINLPFLKEGQYFRILGSTLNDGVYQYPTDELLDETFYGAIWPLRIPQAVLELAEEIEEWQETYGSAVSGPYQSESFGGYSYTKASASTESDSTLVTWQDVFGSRLAAWRKI